MYAVVEGKDLVGKSTFIKQIQEIYKRQGKPLLVVTEPFMVHPSGQLIRDFMAAKHTNNNELYELYQINRNYLWHSVIRPALDEGKEVLSDRNFLSSMVYQESVGMMNVLNQNQEKAPDLIYHLQIDHQTYMERLQKKKGLELIERELAKPEVFDNHTRRYKEACRLVSKLTKTIVINVDSR